MVNFLSKPSNWPLWKEMTASAYRVAFLASIGAVVYGYDVSWWSSVLGMPAFTEKYGVLNAASGTYSISAALQSAGSAIPYAGQALGSLMASPISDRYGRRMGIVVMAILFIIAVIIEVTSNSFWQLVMGRFINGIPMGLAGTLIPIYQSECVPPSCRGSLISLYTWFIDIGAVTATGIVYNTWYRPDSSAYKIVMGIQGIYPLFILASIAFVPETPRYLCMKGRRDEASKVLMSLRVDKESVHQEIEEIAIALNIHTEDSSWFDLFRGSNLRRTIIAVVIPNIEAWQGLSFIGNYLVVFFISLGTTNTYQLVVLINSVLLMTLTLFFWAPDYFGRRTLFLFGSAVMFMSMFIIAGVAGKDVAVISVTRQKVAVGMLFIWSIVYSSTWANLTWITSGEIPTTRLKAKTAGLSFFTQTVSTIVITLVTPYMQSTQYADWGAYIGFFFGSFSFIGFVFIYFYYPEAKGASIEELDMFFDAKLSISEFGKAKRGQHNITANADSKEIKPQNITVQPVDTTQIDEENALN